MLHGETLAYSTPQPSRELIKLHKTGDGPIYGCALVIEVRKTGVISTIEKRWVGSVAKCVRRAKLVSSFWGITQIEACDFQHWCIAPEQGKQLQACFMTPEA